MESMSASQTMRELTRAPPKKGIAAAIERKVKAALGGDPETSGPKTPLEQAKERTLDILRGVELMDRQIGKIAQAEYAEVSRKEMMAKRATQGSTGTSSVNVDPLTGLIMDR